MESVKRHPLGFIVINATPTRATTRPTLCLKSSVFSYRPQFAVSVGPGASRIHPPVFSALRLLTGTIMIMRAATLGCGLSLFLYVRRGVIDYSSLSPDRTPSHVIYVWLRVSVHTLLMGDNNTACKANKKLRQSILGRPATPSRRNRRRMLGD